MKDINSTQHPRYNVVAYPPGSFGENDGILIGSYAYMGSAEIAARKAKRERPAFEVIISASSHIMAADISYVPVPVHFSP